MKRLKEKLTTMSGKKLTALIISITIAVMILPTMFVLYQKLYVEPVLQENPAAVWPYLDPAPFFSTWYGACPIITWIALWFLWTGRNIIKIIKTRKNAVATIALIACLFGSSFFIPAVRANDTIHVDVLCLMDEEAVADRITDFHDIILERALAPRFLNKFNIEFHWHKWYYWDSDDSINGALFLLDEAVGETGWYWGKVVDGEPMELMIAVSGQAQYDPLLGQPNWLGLSLPWYRALIVISCLKIYLLLLHEIGHQFDVLHCGYLFCFMCPTIIMLLAPDINDYCESCSSKMMNNRECFLNTPPSPPRSAPPKFEPQSNWKWVQAARYLGDGIKIYVYTEDYPTGSVSNGIICSDVYVSFFDQQWNFLGEMWFRAVKGEESGW